jgi:hypothetical protein
VYNKRAGLVGSNIEIGLALQIDIACGTLQKILRIFKLGVGVDPYLGTVL